MSLRLAALSFVVTAVAAVAACQSSGPYGTPANAAIGTGIAVAGAAANRAAGGCWANCLPGTVCNKANGLCERAEAHPSAAATPAVGAAGRPAPVANASYPPGHTYDVPPIADAGCNPATNSADPALSCEMDGAAPH